MSAQATAYRIAVAHLRASLLSVFPPDRAPEEWEAPVHQEYGKLIQALERRAGELEAGTPAKPAGACPDCGAIGMHSCPVPGVAAAAEGGPSDGS